MKANRLKIFVLLNVIVIGLLISCKCVPNNADTIKTSTESFMDLQDNNLAQVSDLELPDKVYTFFSPSYSLIFEDIYLEEDYIYYIHIELVTPHNVTNMDVSIWDPDGKLFHAFESKMFYEPEYGRYFDVPYGTAISGKYTFRFDSVTNQNFNLYIRIEQGTKCLHDKIENSQNIISQGCSRFYYDKSVNHYKNLETDTNYKIYIGRVSAIAITENSEVRMDCTIYDPNDVPFIIYANELLEPVDSVSQFSFGTAISGEYNVKIRIYCSVEYVNVAYAICEDFEISEGQDVNDTKAPAAAASNMIEETIEEVKNSVPFEWLIGITTFVGILVAIPCAALLKIKRRKAPEIGIKK